MVRYALAGDLLDELSRSWWLVVLRGFAAVVFGVVALIWPEKTLVALAIVFGLYALADGAALGYAAYRALPGNRLSLAVQAVVGVIVGLVALVWPLVAIAALVFVIGAWAVVTGVAEIITAIRLHAHISSEWLLVFVGALSIVFGLLLWFWPLEGAQAVMLVIAMYAVIFGAVMAVAGFRLRGAAGAFRGPEAGALDDLRDPGEPSGGESTGTYGDLLDDGDREDQEPFGRGRHRAREDDEGYPGRPDEPR
ncbi:hypothetical protein A6A08_01825 [Nocardiopsis sp. TSRI0078]|uniref:HdeD family acid-resistance protein n=1 Tax=unclassified Nocardiopsis TaxID=2649073 RepID=UPI00093BE535|nr:HdeD family acid-resistance protein [Nocardiopsis sp. TSRI0078]OKI23542.1 hypothetical protein A6A08_01825 [Nocardiopsis sp. TSRI0078]